MVEKYFFKTQPYEHQMEALRRSWKKPAFAYLMEMGVGKTKVQIDEIGMLYENREITGALILAPKGVYLNWVQREIPAHLPDRIAETARIVEWRSGGGGAGHQREIDHVVRGEGNCLRVLVMNTEALSTGNTAYRLAAKFLGEHECLMAVDESTFIKNPTSNRTKNVVKLGEFAKYRRILTGSPVTRSPLDLYSQFDFLGHSLLGSRSFYAFRARYAVMQRKNFGGRSVNLVVGYRNEEELAERVKPHSYRVTKDECLDLPEKIYTRRDVELTDEQRRMYTEMKEFAIAELESGEIVSATAVITQLLRLHQVVCGHVTDDNGVVTDVKSNRIRGLMELLEETDGKVIIWSRYRRDIEKIVAEIGGTYGDDSVAQYHGGNTRTRSEDARRFLEEPSCRFMVSNTQSGGYGNTWTVATTVVYYSNDYDLEKRIQSEDRAHRAGQTEHVTYVDLVSPGTVDEKILLALRKKINIASSITGDGYREWII